MTPPLHVIDWPGSGRLATMARPPGGERLRETMSALRQAGVDVLVSALCADEYERAALADEAAAATDAGLDFVSFPIVDCGVPTPDSLPAATQLADRLAAEVRMGRYVVTHCWAGIGRSSLLAGAALVRLGVAPEQAWRLIATARGLTVPDAPDQEAWLYEFAALPLARWP
jgi:protein-tyrosine phosphatase